MHHIVHIFVCIHTGLCWMVYVPRGVYVRYTPAVRNLFVIFPEGQRSEGYITNKLPNIAGVYLKIYTDWTWFIRYMLC